MASQDMLRICREIAGIQKGTDLSIAVAYQESDMRKIEALIIGPPETPYQYGFFEFVITCGPEYPTKPPKVVAQTTNNGRCRFNPNIYAGGKVCLSILGTWEGAPGEQWSAAQGLESVLLSIQSLMSSNPYENEPGFEDSKNDIDVDVRRAYCAKISHETLRVAVISKLERLLDISLSESKSERNTPEDSLDDSSGNDDTEIEDKQQTTLNNIKPEHFGDLLKRRFLWYYDSYLKAVEDGAEKAADGTIFERMPFESPSNGMMGKFRYQELKTRLLRIKEVLDKETRRWAEEGSLAVEKDLNIAYNLQNQFNQFAMYQKRSNLHNVDISLLDGNPFVWIMTYFGRSGSNLDGGVFRIRISLSPKFPEEQPRVQVETNMYHHRVSKHGVLLYLPQKVEEVKHHIEAIVLAIEEVSPAYDPRAIVHPEATALFWGNDSDKKKYNRAQRKSAQDSMEENLG